MFVKYINHHAAAISACGSSRPNSTGTAKVSAMTYDELTWPFACFVSGWNLSLLF
jgi:hypothetical protein